MPTILLGAPPHRARIALGTMTFGLPTEEAAHALNPRHCGRRGSTFSTADVYPLGAACLGGAPEGFVAAGSKAFAGSYLLATKAVGRMGPNHWTMRVAQHLLAADSIAFAHAAAEPIMSISISSIRMISARRSTNARGRSIRS